MIRGDTFQALEKALKQYRLQEAGLTIQFNNIMDQLEGYFGEFYTKEDQSKRARVFFNNFYKKMFKVDTTSYWFSFWEYSLIQFIDLYFQKQIEHHGIQIITAKKILAEPEMRENPAYWFNSASPDQIDTPEYYQNLLVCRSLWQKVSTEARQKAERMCFPMPLIT
jgi:hypothetical protein